MEKFDLKSALIGFAVTFLFCLVVHSIRTDHLESSIYNLILDNQFKNEQLQRAAQDINKLNNNLLMLQNEKNRPQ